MAFLIAVLIGASFGAGDQYLGSLSAIPWLTDVSLLSAPWLALPFLFGCTQLRPKRAVVIGCVAIGAALVGYFVMTLSPAEGVHLNGSVGPILALLHSEAKVVVGGIVTAPLFGFLGYRWRVHRARLSAALVAGALCLEPLARAIVGQLPQVTGVWVAEIASGLVLAVYFGWAGLFRSISSGLHANRRR